MCAGVGPAERPGLGRLEYLGKISSEQCHLHRWYVFLLLSFFSLTSVSSSVPQIYFCLLFLFVSKDLNSSFTSPSKKCSTFWLVLGTVQLYNFLDLVEKPQLHLKKSNPTAGCFLYHAWLILWCFLGDVQCCFCAKLWTVANSLLVSLDHNTSSQRCSQTQMYFVWRKTTLTCSELHCHILIPS